MYTTAIPQPCRRSEAPPIRKHMLHCFSLTRWYRAGVCVLATGVSLTLPPLLLDTILRFLTPPAKMVETFFKFLSDRYDSLMSCVSSEIFEIIAKLKELVIFLWRLMLQTVLTDKMDGGFETFHSLRLNLVPIVFRCIWHNGSDILTVPLECLLNMVT